MANRIKKYVSFNHLEAGSFAKGVPGSAFKHASPRLMQSHKHFLAGLYTGGLNGITFVPGVFHKSYFYLKREVWNKTKNNALAAKCFLTI